MEAINLAYAFELIEQSDAVPLLEAYLRDARKASQEKARNMSPGARVFSEMLLMIGNKLPCNIQNSVAGWALSICSGSIAVNAKAARSLVTLFVYLRSPPSDLVVAQDMASELLKVMGSEERDPVEKSETCTIINHSTENAIPSMILQLIESVIIDLDWAISKL